jgi:ATP-dependent protease Clp ATPase subunit
MLDVMYEIPSDSSIKKFTITKEMVEKEEEKTETQSELGEHAELIQLPKKSRTEIA